MRAYWIRVGPESIESVLKRDKKAHRRLRKKNKCRLSQRLELCCHELRKQGGATGSWERQEQILPQHSKRECSPTHPSILDFWTPEVWENTFLFVYATKFMIRKVIYCSIYKNSISSILTPLLLCHLSLLSPTLTRLTTLTVTFYFASSHLKLP